MPEPAVVAALIDDREPAPVRRACAEAFAAHDPPVACEVTRLAWGDVWLTCDDGALVVAERKSPGDLVQSIVSERLRAQAVGCLGLSPWTYLLVTGPVVPGEDGYAWWDGRASRFRWEALQGALADVQQLGACVLTCQGDADVAPTLLRLARRSREAVRLVPPRPAEAVDAGIALLASLPGIGLEKAQALLAYCGSPAWALDYLTGGQHGLHAHDLSGAYAVGTVPGVGPRTREGVRRALGLAEGTGMTVVTTDALTAVEEAEEVA